MLILCPIVSEGREGWGRPEKGLFSHEKLMLITETRRLCFAVRSVARDGQTGERILLVRVGPAPHPHHPKLNQRIFKNIETSVSLNSNIFHINILQLFYIINIPNMFGAY